MAALTTPRQRARTLESLAIVPLQWTKWRELSQDTELWINDGDAIVHLYSQSKSHRESKLRLKYSDIEALHSVYLLERCEQSHNDEADMDLSTNTTNTAIHEIYVPAPSTLSTEDEYRFHLITRNCFAFASSQPVAGYKLGDALMDVWDRLEQWRSGADIRAKLLTYCEERGYSDFAEHPERALACLKLAEHARMKDLWIEAFTHCVGMHDRLANCAEYRDVSLHTKRILLDASHGMNERIERIFQALSSFLEEELGSEHLGLTKPARDHLDRFRSCINNYYVEKLGYFPPRQSMPWDKHIWIKMYHSFQALYEYLVDKDSSTDPFNSHGLNGGICVAQNVQAFDMRYGCTPLPHPLPLIPSQPLKRSRTLVEAQRGLRTFSFSRSNSLIEPKSVAAKQALERATNTLEPEVAKSPLVQEYQWFEGQKIEEKLPASEARKIRWLLIYGVLQMLIDMVRAPQEVRDTETPSYPLCVDTTNCLPWTDDGEKPETRRSFIDTDKIVVEPSEEEEEADRISIHPDCEAENAEDFFAALGGLSRKPSEMSLNKNSSARVSPALSRTASIRSSVSSSVQALQRSVVGSLNRRNSQRKPSLPSINTRPATQPQRSSSYSELVLQGFGNGNYPYNDGQDILLPPPSEAEEVYELSADSSTSFKDFNFGLGMVTEEPTQLGEEKEKDHIELCGRNASDSSLSASGASTDSKRSSCSCREESDTPLSEFSTSWDESCFMDRNEKVLLTKEPELMSPRPEACNGLPPHPRALASLPPITTASKNFNRGCYTPTGYAKIASLSSGYGPPTNSQFMREINLDSAAESSAGSSLYEEATEQAADIEEEQLRGRRRTRGLDGLKEADLLAEGHGCGVMMT